jgi:uncharacterized small protein (TIGR04563 family)
MSAPIGPRTSVYFPETMLSELEAEARRLDRSVGWLVRKAWQFAREEIRKEPAPVDVEKRR